MDKMGYARGLVGYHSERQLQGGKTHWLRPRIIGYVVVLCLMVGVFWYNVITRVPLELTVIRDRNQLFITTDTGDIDNIYTLQLANMDREMHEFEISIYSSSDLPNEEIVALLLIPLWHITVHLALSWLTWLILLLISRICLWNYICSIL